MGYDADMSVSYQRLLRIVGIALLTVAVYFGFMGVVYPRIPWPIDLSTNPDPNHTHADFAVWVNGVKLDFSDARYMSGISADEESYDEPAEYLDQHLHLHDGIGHVLHRHKPGLPLHDFFTSLGLPMTSECLTLDDYQYDRIDAGWKEDFAIQKKLCSNGKFRWAMLVNGEALPLNPDYVFQDNDKILLAYGDGDDYSPLLEAMTDDACLYSRTCPWRGDPPAENCIADPEVPCVAPTNDF